MLGLPGLLEALVIAFVLLVLFGNRLPGVCREIGKSLLSFKKGLNEPETPEDGDREGTS